MPWWKVPGRAQGGNLGATAQNLKRMAEALKTWSAGNFSHVTRKIEELRRELQQLENTDPVHRCAEKRRFNFPGLGLHSLDP